MTTMISHVATCDADNLGDYQTVLTSTHTNCLIQFVKERLAERFVSTEARILRCPLCLSSVYFEVFCEKLVQLQTLDSLAISRSGRRILQRYNLLSTAFFTAGDLSIEALAAPLKLLTL
ncbi:hypothetical protein [Pseudomonas fluorescens]|uniref:hypothetical protein n=1 Tax=Pseudomonas fluorescens TaxID=294 RepID=UPI00124179AF|nr:hypothetical protein [Pseudomonas fluorescens]